LTQFASTLLQGRNLTVRPRLHSAPLSFVGAPMPTPAVKLNPFYTGGGCVFSDLAVCPLLYDPSCGQIVDTFARQHQYCFESWHLVFAVDRFACRPFVGLLMCLGLLYPVSRLAKALVEEKETKSKETMKM
jgi:hypothetical protein